MIHVPNYRIHKILNFLTKIKGSTIFDKASTPFWKNDAPNSFRVRIRVSRPREISLHVQRRIRGWSSFRCQNKSVFENQIHIWDLSSTCCKTITFLVLRVRAFFHKTVRVCHVYCNFKIGFTCRITVIFGTLKDGSLLINTLASNICFSYRNMFHNGVDALSKIVDAILSKSSKFNLVRIIR